MFSPSSALPSKFLVEQTQSPVHQNSCANSMKVLMMYSLVYRAGAVPRFQSLPVNSENQCSALNGCKAQPIL